MAEYRKKRGSDTWHWRKECSNWPFCNYTIRLSKPLSGKFDKECEEIEKKDCGNKE